MIKVFTLNKNGKIELTKDQLQSLLNDAYYEGKFGTVTTWTYTSPSITPYYTWTGSTLSAENINPENITTATNNLTIKTNL